MKSEPKPATRPKRKRLLIVVAGIAAVLLFAGAELYIWYNNSPFLSTMLIRKVFDDGGRATNVILEKYAPKYIPTVENLQYRKNDGDALLDIYYASNYDSAPTIVWIHGGGWIAGNKDGMDPWARILAGKGFNVVAVNYWLAPEKTYPLQIIQVNSALKYLNDNASELHLQPSKIILAGDSAGAQLAAQAALIETSPSYAKEVNIKPALANGKITAMLLNCGAYDLRLIKANDKSKNSKLVSAFLWSYTGKKDFLSDADFKYSSIPQYVTKDFPPSFITAGNKDPLLNHSESLAKALKIKDVAIDTLFFPANYKPELNHEYQFNLDTKEGNEALDRMVEFAQKYAN